MLQIRVLSSDSRHIVSTRFFEGVNRGSIKPGGLALAKIAAARDEAVYDTCCVVGLPTFFQHLSSRCCWISQEPRVS